MNEIEIKGVLSPEEFNNLKQRLNKEGKFEESFKRLSVEIGPGYDPKTRSWSQHRLNLRVKKSDQDEKISLKVGKVTDTKLAEYEVHIKSGEYLTALELLAALGFDKGLIYFWESEVYEYQGAEVKISKYTDDYFMWEIEAREKDSEEKAEQRVHELAQELGLKPLTPDQFMEQVAYQNDHIFEEYTLDRIKELLALHYSVG